MNEPVIEVELSTPSQTRPAQSIGLAAPHLPELRKGHCLDFGAGRLRNYPAIRAGCARVTCVETQRNVSKLKDQLDLKRGDRFLTYEEFLEDGTCYNGAYCISVLHTIPDPVLRQRYLTDIHERLPTGAPVLIDVPNHETYYIRRFNAGKLRSHKDGWLISHGEKFAFYKNYTAKTFDALWGELGLFRLRRVVRQTKHLIRILETV